MQFNRISIEYTRKCIARCKHCVVCSSPENNEKISIRNAKRYVKEAAEYGIKNISITGGEPFLFLKEIKALIKTTNNFGIKTSILTNGYWAIDRNITKEILFELKSLGLSRMLLSTDIYHIEFIPIERIIHAIEEGRSLGLIIEVNVSTTRHLEDSVEIIRQLSETGIKPFIRPILCRGRAIVLKERLVEKTSFFHLSTIGCQFRLMPLIRVNGAVLSCCFANKDIIEENNYLFLGNANKESLFEILKRGEENYFVKALFEGGPKKIFNETEKLKPIFFSKKTYQSLCDFCTELLNIKNWKDI